MKRSGASVFSFLSRSAARGPCELDRHPSDKEVMTMERRRDLAGSHAGPVEGPDARAIVDCRAEVARDADDRGGVLLQAIRNFRDRDPGRPAHADHGLAQVRRDGLHLRRGQTEPVLYGLQRHGVDEDRANGSRGAPGLIAPPAGSEAERTKVLGFRGSSPPNYQTPGKLG